MNRKITTLLSILIAGSSLLMIDCSGNGSKKTDDMSIPDSIFEN